MSHGDRSAADRPDPRVQAPRAPRSFPRLSTRGEAELVAIDQGRPQPNLVPIQIQDVAWVGFGFLSAVPLEVGSRWRALFIHEQQQVGAQTIVIRHCQEIGSGRFRAGAQVCVDGGLIALLNIEWPLLAPGRPPPYY